MDFSQLKNQIIKKVKKHKMVLSILKYAATQKTDNNLIKNKIGKNNLN